VNLFREGRKKKRSNLPFLSRTLCQKTKFKKMFSFYHGKGPIRPSFFHENTLNTNI